MDRRRACRTATTKATTTTTRARTRTVITASITTTTVAVTAAATTEAQSFGALLATPARQQREHDGCEEEPRGRDREQHAPTHAVIDGALATGGDHDVRRVQERIAELERALR